MTGGACEAFADVIGGLRASGVHVCAIAGNLISQIIVAVYTGSTLVCHNGCLYARIEKGSIPIP